jgi:hopanoid biosynthesis associated protein HpnK
LTSRIIITGDDFGLSEDINQAIILAYERGILTSASLLVNAPASENAIRLAKKSPGLCVGLHLALVQSKATLPHTEIPGLVDNQGYFPDDPVAVGFKYYFQKSLRKQLKKEIRAQIEKFFASGLTLSHLSGHLNLHVHPQIFLILREFLTEYSIPGFRLPREPLGLNLYLDRTHLVSKLFHFFTFRLLARNCSTWLKDKGIFFPQQVFGLLQGGKMNEAYLMGLLKNLSPETVEIYFHLSNKHPWPQNSSYQPQEELKALLSPKLRSLIQSQKIKLTSYQAIINRPLH